MEITGNYSAYINNITSHNPWQALIARLDAMQAAVQKWLDGDRDPTIIGEIELFARVIHGSTQPTDPKIDAELQMISTLGKDIQNDTPAQVEQLNRLITDVLNYLKN